MFLAVNSGFLTNLISTISNVIADFHNRFRLVNLHDFTSSIDEDPKREDLVCFHYFFTPVNCDEKLDKDYIFISDDVKLYRVKNHPAYRYNGLVVAEIVEDKVKSMAYLSYEQAKRELMYNYYSKHQLSCADEAKVNYIMTRPNFVMGVCVEDYLYAFPYIKTKEIDIIWDEYHVFGKAVCSGKNIEAYFEVDNYSPEDFNREYTGVIRYRTNILSISNEYYNKAMLRAICHKINELDYMRNNNKPTIIN